MIEALRQTRWSGTPDQSILDFITTVWQINLDRSATPLIRIVLVGPDEDWQSVDPADDRPGDDADVPADPDQLIAKAILADLEAHVDDARAAVFITDRRYAPKQLAGEDGRPIRTAADLIAGALGDDRITTIRLLTAGGDRQSDRHFGQETELRISTAHRSSGLPGAALPLRGGPFTEYAKAYGALIFVEPMPIDPRAALIEEFYNPLFLHEIDRRAQAVDPAMGRVDGPGSPFDYGAFKQRIERAYLGDVDISAMGIIGDEESGKSDPNDPTATQPSKPRTPPPLKRPNETDLDP
ncbi:MAG: hypothetical protein CMJ49_02050 [Planctomycetaceae bacterium]|nr:hypothetical protein [Planctomycetaceae bacterium]